MFLKKFLKNVNIVINSFPDADKNPYRKSNAGECDHYTNIIKTVNDLRQ